MHCGAWWCGGFLHQLCLYGKIWMFDSKDSSTWLSNLLSRNFVLWGNEFESWEERFYPNLNGPSSHSLHGPSIIEMFLKGTENLQIRLSGMLKWNWISKNQRQHYFFQSVYSVLIVIWAASWQNRRNGMCAQRRLRSAWASAQSDQSLRYALNGYAFLIWTVKTLIRLGGCPGWSESSLGAQSYGFS